jgi:hypothetical protein
MPLADPTLRNVVIGLGKNSLAAIERHSAPFSPRRTIARLEGKQAASASAESTIASLGSLHCREPPQALSHPA